MVERKKIAGGGGGTGAEARTLLPDPPPQSRPVHFSSRLYFSSFPLSESESRDASSIFVAHKLSLILYPKFHGPLQSRYTDIFGDEGLENGSEC